MPACTFGGKNNVRCGKNLDVSMSWPEKCVNVMTREIIKYKDAINITVSFQVCRPKYIFNPPFSNIFIKPCIPLSCICHRCISYQQVNLEYGQQCKEYGYTGGKVLQISCEEMRRLDQKGARWTQGGVRVEKFIQHPCMRGVYKAPIVAD